MSFVNIKASNLRFLSPQNLLVYIWTHLGQVPTVAVGSFLSRSGSSQLLKSSTQRFGLLQALRQKCLKIVFYCHDTADAVVLKLTFRLPEIAQTRLYLVQRCHCPGSQGKKQISGCVGDRLNIMNKWEDVQCYFCVKGSMRKWLEENTSSVRSCCITWFLVI